MTTTFYKLYHINDPDKSCYVGSTSNYAVRMSTHKSHCNNVNSKKYNFNVYRYIRNNGGFDNWMFRILGHHETMQKLPRMLMERAFIEEHHASLNEHMPGAVLEFGLKEYKKRGSYLRQIAVSACDRCGAIYRGKTNKSCHQKTKRCMKQYAIKLAQLAEDDADDAVNDVVNDVDAVVDAE